LRPGGWAKTVLLANRQTVIKTITKRIFGRCIIFDVFIAGYPLFYVCSNLSGTADIQFRLYVFSFVVVPPAEMVTDGIKTFPAREGMNT
jgi:hypothetical protein